MATKRVNINDSWALLYIVGKYTEEYWVTRNRIMIIVNNKLTVRHHVLFDGVMFMYVP